MIDNGLRPDLRLNMRIVDMLITSNTIKTLPEPCRTARNECSTHSSGGVFFMFSGFLTDFKPAKKEKRGYTLNPALSYPDNRNLDINRSIVSMVMRLSEVVAVNLVRSILRLCPMIAISAAMKKSIRQS